MKNKIWFEKCNDCPTLPECQCSNVEDCTRRGEPQPDQDEIERDKISKSNAIGMGLIPPDQSRLLTPEEIVELCDKWEDEYENVEMTDAEWEIKRFSLLVAAQRDLTASIKDAKCTERVKKVFNTTARLGQARREALIEEVDEIFSVYADKFHIPTIKWKYIRVKYLKANPTSEVEGC